MLIGDDAWDKDGCSARVHDTFRDRDRNLTVALSPKYTGGAAIGGHGAHGDVGGEFDVGVPDTQTGPGGVNVPVQHLSLDGDRARDDAVLDGGRQEAVLGHEMDAVDGRALGCMGDGRVARALPASGKRISDTGGPG